MAHEQSYNEGDIVSLSYREIGNNSVVFHELGIFYRGSIRLVGDPSFFEQPTVVLRTVDKSKYEITEEKIFAKDELDANYHFLLIKILEALTKDDFYIPIRVRVVLRD